MDPMPRYCLYCLPLTKTSWPGDSSHPASREPSMTESAPATRALAMSPEYCSPPSAMSGTPAGRHACAARCTAVTCGTPTPATTRVVQMEPGPTPTLTASTPASTSAWAPSRVATFPPMICTPENALSFFIRAIMSSSSRASPFAVSATRTSAPASARAVARSQASPQYPMAAPTRSRPSESLVAWGNCSDLTKSFTVMSPRSLPASSTSGSFSILCLASSAAASSELMPTGPVTRGIRVMASRTRRLPNSLPGMKRRSRLVTMPSSTPRSSTTGSPETRYWPHRASSSASVASGPIVTGSVTMPDSDRFTTVTWCAWSSMERLRCRMPMPPSRAIAIAIRASVTVSMAAEISGILIEISRVSRAVVSTSEGITSVAPGSRSTSS
nr:hypothetical protein DA06_06290 [Georgenia sp. SUBG003]